MKRLISSALVLAMLCAVCLTVPLGAAYGASAGAGRAADGGGRVQLKALGPSDLIGGVLKSLINSAGRNLAERGLKGSDSIGWLLAAFGLDGVFGQDELAPIREKLDELSKQVGEIRGELKHAELNRMVGQTHEVTSKIDHSFKQLEQLSRLRPDDPTRANFARRISSEIGANLLTAPNYFDKILGSNVPLSSNLIKTASRVVHADHRFFDKQQSAEIREVYEYFATYQTELAVLLAEYFHTEPQIYSPQVIEDEIREIEKNLANQEKSLKPPVPDNAVIDTKTDLMWVQAGRQAEKRPTMGDYIGLTGETKKGALWQNGDIKYTINEQANNASPWDVPWGGQWRLPTIAQFQALISDRNGAAPIPWLIKEGRFSPGYLEAADSHFWTNPSDWHLVVNRVEYKFFNLRTGEVARTRTQPYVPGKWREAFAKPSTVATYNRRLAPGEDYWWR